MNCLGALSGPRNNTSETAERQLGKSMYGDPENSVAMTPYVLIVGATKFLIAMGALALANIAGVNIGSGSSGLSIATIIPGVGWFAYRVDRPMVQGERLRFALGVMLVDIVLSVITVLLILVLSGLPLSPKGVDLALFGGKDFTFDPLLILVFGFSSAATFAAAYLFGWTLTRKLPRRRPLDQSNLSPPGSH